MLITCLDAILAGSFLMLTIVAPRQLSPIRQRTQIYVWTAINFVVFSILVSIFRVKNRGACAVGGLISDVLMSFRLPFQAYVLELLSISYWFCSNEVMIISVREPNGKLKAYEPTPDEQQ